MKQETALGRVVALVSPKGGVGKSTLAINLAALWHSEGQRVLLVDADPQGTSLTWATTAEEHERQVPSCIGAGDNLRTALESLIGQHDVTIIDTPGRNGRRVRAALMLSDMVLLPVGPSPADVWALGDALETIAEAKELRPELEAWIVVNRSVRTRVGQAAVQGLTEAGVSVAPVTIGNRTVFPEAMASGHAVISYAGGSIAAVETRRLGGWVADILGVPAVDMNHVA